MKFNNGTELINHLIENEKTEDTVFIIGGGPSVSKYLPDPRVLDDHDVICTNNAYKLFPDAMLLHYADRVWWTWHTQSKHDVENAFKGNISSASHNPNSHIDRHNQRVTCFYTDNKKGGISPDTNKLNGCNTGHQAINIAVHMGYKQIVLIGFDLNRDKKTHWHNDHERTTNVDNFQRRMIPGFERIAPFQKELGFKVYNLNPDSAIRSFKFAKLEDFI